MVPRRVDSAVAAFHAVTEDLADILPARVRRVGDRIRRIGKASIDWPPLRIGDRTATTPIVQGGMGVGISLSGLAGAVAEVGGIGVIAAAGIGMLERDYYRDGRAANIRAFRREIRAARAKTDGLIGVNIMVALNDFHQLLDVAIEERVDFVFMGAGLPIKGLPVERMRERGVQAVPIVSSARATTMIFRMWTKIYDDVPDAVVVEGPLAGGHLGFADEELESEDHSLSDLVPEVAAALAPFATERGREIPVIAAGGIFDGGDIHNIMARGASGVQMGTRFVATEECDADQRFKEAYVDATAEDIGIIQSPVGMPGRAIRNSFITDSEEGRRPAFRCAWQCLSSCKADKARYCISIALNNARQGKLKQGFAFVGTNGYRVAEISTVPALVGQLAREYRTTVAESVAARLESLVDQVSMLKHRYDRLRSGVRATRLSLENGAVRRIRAVRGTSVLHLRSGYNDLRRSMQTLQKQLTERIADGLVLLEQ